MNVRSRSPVRVLRKSKGGWALGTTLACMIALSVLLFAAVSAGVSHLQMVSKTTNAQHAKNLAEAALSKAIAELVKSDYKFGKNGSDRVEVSVPDLEGSSGVVTFNRSESGFSDGYSTYNLDRDSNVSGGGARSHQVPPRTVHLVARGRVGSSESWMECLYYKPPFPDGLAASGPVWVRSLYLAAVTSGQAYSGGDPGQIAPEDSRPANLFTNATGATAAQILEGCHITGSAGAMGGVSVDPDSQVLGEVLPGSEERAIPEIDVRARMDALRPNAVDVASTGGNLELDPDWFAQATSGLTVGGDLDLKGSVLLVTGDLRVAGAIKGTGVILVDGSVEITDGRSNVTSADQVAIACTRDFNLRAEAPEGNYFQGLVYCEGDFEAKHITVVGATVVNGKNGAQGEARLDNVRFVQTPGSVEMELLRARGFGAHANNWAWSFTLKPNPNGVEGEYLCDARAYHTDTVISGCSDDAGHDHENPSHCPNKDKPLVWEADTRRSGDSHDGFGAWNSVTGVTEMTYPSGGGGHQSDPPTRTQGTAYPDGIPVKLTRGADSRLRMELINGTQLSPLGQELFNFFKKLQERHDNPGSAEAGIRNLLETRIESSLSEDNYQVTFNLNTLLGESIGSSRVLLWRPFR